MCFIVYSFFFSFVSCGSVKINGYLHSYFILAHLSQNFCEHLLSVLLSVNFSYILYLRANLSTKFPWIKGIFNLFKLKDIFLEAKIISYQLKYMDKTEQTTGKFQLHIKHSFVNKNSCLLRCKTTLCTREDKNLNMEVWG